MHPAPAYSMYVQRSDALHAMTPPNTSAFVWGPEGSDCFLLRDCRYYLYDPCMSEVLREVTLRAGKSANCIHEVLQQAEVSSMTRSNATGQPSARLQPAYIHLLQHVCILELVAITTYIMRFTLCRRALLCCAHGISSWMECSWLSRRKLSPAS